MNLLIYWRYLTIIHTTFNRSSGQAPRPDLFTFFEIRKSKISLHIEEKKALSCFSYSSLQLTNCQPRRKLQEHGFTLPVKKFTIDLRVAKQCLRTQRRLFCVNNDRLRKSCHETGAPNDNFRKNICSEDDLRSRIFVTFFVKFLAFLPLLGFSNI